MGKAHAVTATKVKVAKHAVAAMSVKVVQAVRVVMEFVACMRIPWVVKIGNQ